MTIPVKQLLKEALKLSDQERADLAVKLIESLCPEMEEKLRENWEAEIERRLKNLKQGTSKTVPWSEARRRILGQKDE